MTPNSYLIRKLSQQKAKLIDKKIKELESIVQYSANEFQNALIRDFVEKLNTDKGIILETQNVINTKNINEIFKKFQNEYSVEIINKATKDFLDIINENNTFYKKSLFDVKDIQEKIKFNILKRIGISEDGTLIRNGYMQNLFESETLRTDILKFVMKNINKGIGLQNFKLLLKNYLTGNDKKLGLFQRYYKGFAYDTYSQIDALTGKQYAEKLNLKYFIYQGGIIETSRKFCIEKNGKVFSTEEAEKWKNDPNLTAIESNDTYNWLIERGGYNCRHNIDFISEEIAFAMRPELKIKII